MALLVGDVSNMPVRNDWYAEAPIKELGSSASPIVADLCSR
jgi:hypothetical protein